ncbi:hypothetical protein C0J52_23890, partial [Blattella germanica]
FELLKQIKLFSLFFQVGDHIEKIDSENLVGRRHFEVAKMLKEIPKNSTFTIRLVEPLKDGFINVGPKGDPRKGKKANYGTGKETLRFRANGEAQIEEQVTMKIQSVFQKLNICIPKCVELALNNYKLFCFMN